MLKLKKSRWVCWLALGTFCGQLVATPMTMAEGWGRVVPQTNVQKLAKQIDKLERHLDEYGTVVAKSPDVWGQARLTKYRQEYEEILEGEKKGFKDTLNAAISRSDQAFLASALAMQAAISGQPATMTMPVTRESSSSKTFWATNPDGSYAYDQKGNPVVLKETTPVFVDGEEVQQIKVPDSTASAEGLVKSTSPFFNTESATMKEIQGFAKEGVALEPTVHLDQMSRYLNHLHELRRISDGDDKADSPGYALHLVRLPVSILPGKKTREGYGAEVTFIAKPHLHNRLLPTTFRGLVINDVVEHFAFPLASFIDRDDAEKTLKSISKLTGNEAKLRELILELESLDVLVCRIRQGLEGEALVASVVQAGQVLKKINQHAKDLKLIPENEDESHSKLSKLDQLASGIEAEGSNYSSAKGTELPLGTAESPSDALSKSYNSVLKLRDQVYAVKKEVDDSVGLIVEQSGQINELLTGRLSNAQVSIPSMAGARNRRAILPYPQTLAVEVMGVEQLIQLAELVLPLKESRFNSGSTLILEMQTFLSEEFNEAYEFLNHNEPLWQSCTSELAKAVRSKDKCSLAIQRDNFLSQIHVSKDMQFTGALAWAIIVESALLNERLIEDMKELSTSKNAICLNTSWLPYFGPNPPPEASQAFNDYVNCRWPIHVVAIDPVTQDQNVADRFSQRREMQLALSLAFATGNLGAQSFSRLNRRLELDMETIALHRTTVGFSHGDDTFGWRFMPRVQSPDTESPCRAVGRMLFTGGPTRDYLEKESRLEPGIRECTAVVIMPSFVPYVIFDMRTNWFKLNNPAKKELDLRDGVGLSQEITTLRCLSEACINDQHLYRQDEIHRLNRSVDQLEERLPLQTAYVQMPFENSLGGFEFFNSGVSDLAPELKGFYGEPGIKQGAAETTTLFLVGDHFSNHETKVVVGNKAIEGSTSNGPNMKLLSRQVMQVTIPGTVHSIEGVVDVHVATPYGVSNHIVIPVFEDSSSTAEAIAAHVALKHVDQYSWVEATGAIQLQVNSRRQVSKVFQQTDNVIQTPKNSPFASDKGKAKFRGWVFEKLSGKDVAAKPIQTAKMEIEFSDGKASVRDQSSGLEFALQQALKDYSVPADLESLEIQGFLKFNDAENTTDGQPVIKLENRLKLKVTVKVCDAKCPDDMPCPPAASISSPFDEIQPASAAITAPVRRSIKPAVSDGPRLIPRAATGRVLVE